MYTLNASESAASTSVMPMSGILKGSGGIMRRLMSVALIGLVVAGAATVAAAQGVGGSQAPQAGRAGIRGGAGSDSLRGHRGGPGGARGALAGLNLSQTQKDQVKTINKKYAEQFNQLRQANGTNGVQNADAGVRMRTIAEQERAEIRAVLTPDQRTQFDANVARHRGKGKGGRGTNSQR